MKGKNPLNLSLEDVKHDIDVILLSIQLQHKRRFFHQRYWETETQAADYASLIEPFPRLESVAEHSWHVADTVLLIGSHFPSLNVDHCLKLAIMHDKMEIFTEDKNPVGRDGTGLKTHAFNVEKQTAKESEERNVIYNKYLPRLRPSAYMEQERILLEMLETSSEEARFVKAVDKLQALAFMFIKKKGSFRTNHLKFTLRYSRKILEYYFPLHVHYEELWSRILSKVAKERNITLEQLRREIGENQLELF